VCYECVLEVCRCVFVALSCVKMHLGRCVFCVCYQVLVCPCYGLRCSETKL